MSVYRPNPAATPDIIMLHGGNVDVCVHKRDQMALYFKTPDRKYAVGNSGYQEEPGKIVCIDRMVMITSLKNSCHRQRTDKSLVILNFVGFMF